MNFVVMLTVTAKPKIAFRRMKIHSELLMRILISIPPRKNSTLERLIIFTLAW